MTSDEQRAREAFKPFEQRLLFEDFYAGWQAAQQAPQARAALLEEAARACEKRAEERCHECGRIDETTGAWEGPSWAADLNEEDDECAAAIRALAANPQQSTGESETGVRATGARTPIAADRGNRRQVTPTDDESSTSQVAHPNPQIASEPKGE